MFKNMGLTWKWFSLLAGRPVAWLAISLFVLVWHKLTTDKLVALVIISS
jgi:hypothetical protein